MAHSSRPDGPGARVSGIQVNRSSSIVHAIAGLDFVTKSCKRSFQSPPGGARQGAGRKPAYGEPTKTVRVPHSLVPVVVGYLAAMKRGPVGVAGGAVCALFPRAASPSLSRPGRRVRAGKLTSGDDYQEDAVDLGKHLVRDPGDTFVMKVDGWSMRDAGIADERRAGCRSRCRRRRRTHVIIADIDGELT